MHIYHSLDFEAAKQRVEKYEPGENIVHDEDYEDINTLVRRAERTRTIFKPDPVCDEDFDFDEDELSKAFADEVNNKLSQNVAVEPEEGSTEGEQSKPAVTLPDGSNEPSVTP